MANGRNSNGTFGHGNPGGPGRPRRGVEREYLAAFAAAVPLADWQAIIQKAVAVAQQSEWAHRAAPAHGVELLALPARKK
jgi:hypothetical protein